MFCYTDGHINIFLDQAHANSTDSIVLRKSLAMVFNRNLTLLALTFMVIACTDSADKVVGKENPVQSIRISEIDVSEDYTSTSFKLTNTAEATYYSTVIVIAEFRKDGQKVGSERLVIYPVPLFGPDSAYVYEQPLFPARDTDEVHLFVERASFYPERELKAVLESLEM